MPVLLRVFLVDSYPMDWWLCWANLVLYLSWWLTWKQRSIQTYPCRDQGWSSIRMPRCHHLRQVFLRSLSLGPFWLARAIPGWSFLPSSLELLSSWNNSAWYERLVSITSGLHCFMVANACSRDVILPKQRIRPLSKFYSILLHVSGAWFNACHCSLWVSLLYQSQNIPRKGL